MAARGLMALAVACSLAGCGGQDAASSDPAHWKARADEAFARAQADAGRPGVSEVHARAALAYRNAFRLEDPVPGRRAARALLAFRTGRSLSKAAYADPTLRISERRAQGALLWFDEALALEPSLRQVWFERARIHEAPLASVRNLQAAREAYARYLEASQEAGRVPEGELPRIQRARERVEALTGPGAGK